MADGPVGVTGYCMGTRIGLRIAAAHPARVAALAGFHGGGLVTDDAASPHRSAGALEAEVYFGHADEDGATRRSRSRRSTRPSPRPACPTAPRSTRAPTTATRCPTRRSTTRQACERHFAALFDLLDRRVASRS